MTSSISLVGALFFACGALTVVVFSIYHAFANRGSSAQGARSIFDDAEPVNTPTDTLFQPNLKKANPIQ